MESSRVLSNSLNQNLRSSRSLADNFRVTDSWRDGYVRLLANYQVGIVTSPVPQTCRLDKDYHKPESTVAASSIHAVLGRMVYANSPFWFFICRERRMVMIDRIHHVLCHPLLPACFTIERLNVQRNFHL